MKYKEWLSVWLEKYIKPSSKIRTYDRYCQLTYGHIIPALGEEEMKDISPIKLQDFIAELLQTGNLKTKKGLSPNTVNTIITILQSSMKSAYALGIANHDSANTIKRLSLRKGKPNVFRFPNKSKSKRRFCRRRRKSSSESFSASTRDSASENCSRSNGRTSILKKDFCAWKDPAIWERRKTENMSGSSIRRKPLRQEGLSPSRNSYCPT